MRDDLDEDSTRIEELPYSKRLNFKNIHNNVYARFKSICIQEGLMQELAIMLAPIKPVASVNYGLKIARMLVSKSEVPILLNEL